MEPADTLILHPTAGDVITAFVVPPRPTEKRQPPPLRASQRALGRLGRHHKAHATIFQALIEASREKKKKNSARKTRGGDESAKGGTLAVKTGSSRLDRGCSG